jgi:hypothetical protein
MAIELLWGVHFVGGPFDGRVDVYESPDCLPPIVLFAAFESHDHTEYASLASISSFALCQLDHDSSRYFHLVSLPAS